MTLYRYENLYIFGVYPTTINRHVLNYYENPLCEKLQTLGEEEKWAKNYV